MFASTPYPESLTPSSGSGYAKTFEFISVDGDSWTEISGLQPLFSSNGSYTNACDFWIDVGSKGIWLRSDDNTSWGSPVIAGQSGTLQNHQCILSASDSSIGQYNGDPNRMQVKLK